MRKVGEKGPSRWSKIMKKVAEKNEAQMKGKIKRV